MPRADKSVQTREIKRNPTIMKFHFSLFHSIRAVFLTAATLAFLIQCSPAAETPSPLTLFYTNAATNWNEALPLGNGRLGAMVFGTPGKERLQLNEESLWAGCPVEAWPPDFPKHLAEVRRLLFAGKNAEAQAYGVAHLTATPTSFRSYEPLADLWLDFGAVENVTGYRRELILADGIARVTFRQGDATLTREAFISAPDNVLAVRVKTDKPGTLAFTVSLTRQRNATVTATADGQLHLDGQIVDVEKKDGGYDDNPGGSGPGGAHMKFAGRLLARVDRGKVTCGGQPVAHRRRRRGGDPVHGRHRLQSGQTRLRSRDRSGTNQRGHSRERGEEVVAGVAPSPPGRTRRHVQSRLAATRRDGRRAGEVADRCPAGGGPQGWR